MRRRTGKFVAALVGSAALLLAACGGGDGGGNGDGDEGKPVVGGSIKVGLEAEATGLRPWEDSCSSPCYNIMATVFDKLVEATDTGYKPFLAESLTANEGLNEWTLKLRSGIKFHNGVDLTAQTLVDMFEIQKEGSASSSGITATGLTAVEKVDDLTVVYKLSKAYAAFDSELERAPLGMVFEPAAAKADSAAFSLEPIGTGPFKIQSRDVDNETVVVKNPDYWNKDADGTQLPYLDQVTFTPIPDEGQRLSALTSGTIDAFQTLRQGTIRDARAAGGLKMYEYQGNNTGGGMFNTLIAPYDDVRVRLGLNLANNQEQVINALGGTGISSPATQWFSPDSVWYTEEAAATYPKFDLDAAKAKLQEYIDDPARSDGKAAGDKISVELSCPPDPTLVAAMQVLEAAWTSTGLVDVTLTAFDQPTHINNAVGDKHNAHCWRWGGEGDPQAGLAAFFADPATSVGNFPNYVNAEAQALVEEAGKTTDFELRKANYSKLMIIMNESGIVWYSGHTATAVAAKQTVNGLTSWKTPDGSTGAGIKGAEARWAFAWVTAG